MGYGDDIGVYGNSDCKARRLLSDPLGGSPTFGPWIDIPGAAEISVKAEMSVITGQGDDEEWDVGRVKKYTGKATFGRESISALKQLIGGSDSEVGSEPYRVREWNDEKKKTPLIELCWRPNQEEGEDSDLVRTMHKARITAYELTDKFETASTPSFEYSATRRKSDQKRYSVKVRETGEDLPLEDEDLTPPTVTAVTPTDGTSGSPVTLAGIVTYTFSSNVDHAWASDIGSYYYGSAANGNPVAFGLEYDAETRVATLTPTANITTATKYVSGVTKNLRSKAGVRLANQYGIDFTAP